MNQTLVLLSSLLLIALIIAGCPGKITPPKKVSVFYIDKAYYQFKKAQLITCLAQRNLRDTCKCATEYLKAGNPVPGKNSPEGLGAIPDNPTVSFSHYCCECGKSELCNPCDSLCSTPNCRCDLSEIIVSPEEASSNSLKFADVDQNGKPTDNIITNYSKRNRIIGNNPFTEFVFPSNYSKRVAFYYKGTYMGILTLQNGQVLTWDITDAGCPQE